MTPAASPDEKFQGIVEGIRAHLVEEYGRDETGRLNVDARTRAERPAAVPIRAEAPLYTKLVSLNPNSSSMSFAERRGRHDVAMVSPAAGVS